MEDDSTAAKLRGGASGAGKARSLSSLLLRPFDGCLRPLAAHAAPLRLLPQGRDKLPNDLAGRFEPFIGAYYARNITITTNSSGIINGGGLAWWAAKAAGQLNNTPPHLFEAGWSSYVTIGAPLGSPLNALILESSPFWNIHLYDRCGRRPRAPRAQSHSCCQLPTR